MGEEAGLDRPQDERAVAVELFAGRGEALHEFERVVQVAPEELVLRGALEKHDLQVLVLAHGPEHEGDLVARFSLEVEDLLGAVPDLHDRVQFVVLQDAFARLSRDPEGQLARALGVQRDRDRGDQGLPVVREGHFLGGDDPAHVLDHDRNRAPGEPARVHDHGDHHRGACQRLLRNLRAAGLHVGFHLFVPQPDREDGHRRGAERQQRLAEGRVGVVPAVGDDHDARERHPLQLVAGVGQRIADPGVAAVEGHRVHAVDPCRRGREAEVAEREVLVQRIDQVAIRMEESRGLVRAGGSVTVVDGHAAGVVDEHGQEVPLRHDRRQHQPRLHDDEEEQQERGAPESRQHPAVGCTAFAAGAGVGEHGGHHECDRDDRHRSHRPGRQEGEIALLVQDGTVLEEEFEEAAHGALSGSCRR